MKNLFKILTALSVILGAYFAGQHAGVKEQESKIDELYKKIQSTENEKINLEDKIKTLEANSITSNSQIKTTLENK